MFSRRTFISTAIAAAASHAFAEEPRLKIGQIGAQHSHASGKMEAMRNLDSIYDVVGLVSLQGIRFFGRDTGNGWRADWG